MSDWTSAQKAQALLDAVPPAEPPDDDLHGLKRWTQERVRHAARRTRRWIVGESGEPANDGQAAAVRGIAEIARS